MNNISLLDLKLCVGCRNCENTCPVSAIKILEDKVGFLTPYIDEKKCINCGLCLKKCQIDKHVESIEVKKAYGFQISNKAALSQSSSGGFFYALAKYVISNNGIVVGAMQSISNNEISVNHICCSSIEEINKMQGTKYVQSDLTIVFKEIKNYLNDNKIVLFSGTSCQVFALKLFLNKEYDNLITVGLICHGVPNKKILNDYIKTILPNNANLIDFKFRDKEKQWGLFGSIKFSKNNKDRKKYFNSDNSTYYRLFLDSYIYRNSCYECKFAYKSHQSDFTIGDFWGAKKKNSKIDYSKGLSCVLLNTKKSISVFNGLMINNLFFDTSFESISKNNEQLLRPSKKPYNCDLVKDYYRNYGYTKAAKFYYKNLGLKKYYYFIKSKTPRIIVKIFKSFK